MTNVANLVVPLWNEMSNGLLISEVKPVYEYVNQQKTDKILGYKGTFLLTEGVGMGAQLDIKVDTSVAPDWKLMEHYEFDFDKEKSKVYVSGRNLALSLWAKSVTRF